MRAVLDTNVVISALIWGGKPLSLFAAASEGSLHLQTSPILLSELRGVLERRHLAARLERRHLSIERAVALYARLVTVHDAPPLSVAVARDPDDDAVLAVAVAAQADLVVSGDRDLLVLGPYVGMAIVTPAQALAMLAA